MMNLLMHTRLPRRRGVILIIVIWITTGLVTMGLYFANSLGLEYRAADNAFAGAQADQAIAGTERYIKYVLANLEIPGVAPSIENAEYRAQQLPIGEANVWLVGRDPDSEEYPATPVYGLVDEASKLNINNTRVTQQMLEGLPGMTPDLAASIVNWRTTDSTVVAGGATSQDYQGNNPPYNIKNNKFETPDELRLLLDFDMTLLYGEDTNRNGVLDPNEDDGNETWPPDNHNGRLDPGLTEYITTFTDGHVNARTAPWQVLAVLLLSNSQNAIPGAEQLAKQLVSAREGLSEAALETNEWITSAIGADQANAIRPFITLQSTRYSADICAVGHDGHGFRRAFAVFDVGTEITMIYRRDLTRLGWPLGSRTTLFQATAGMNTPLSRGTGRN